MVGGRSAEIDHSKLYVLSLKPNFRLEDPIHVSRGLATRVCDNEIKPSCNGQGVALCNYCFLSETNAQPIRFLIGVGLLAMKQSRSTSRFLDRIYVPLNF